MLLYRLLNGSRKRDFEVTEHLRTYALELEITAYSLETAKINTSQITQNSIFRL